MPAFVEGDVLQNEKLILKKVERNGYLVVNHAISVQIPEYFIISASSCSSFSFSFWIPSLRLLYFSMMFAEV
jgi:hypothetical protein